MSHALVTPVRILLPIRGAYVNFAQSAATARNPRPITAAVGLILGPLDLAASQAIGLVDGRRNLLLHGKGQLEHYRRDGLDEQFADRAVGFR